MKQLLNEMLFTVVAAHDGQYDLGGQPYALHPLAVMHMLQTEDEELQCIALGHDLLEDTDVTYEQLFKKFGRRIADSIYCMSKRDGLSYEDYKVQVKSNPDSIKVKMCDLRHNSDITRLNRFEERDLERLKKYALFYKELEECSQKF